MHNYTNGDSSIGGLQQRNAKTTPSAKTITISSSSHSAEISMAQNEIATSHPTIIVSELNTHRICITWNMEHIKLKRKKGSKQSRGRSQITTIGARC